MSGSTSNNTVTVVCKLPMGVKARLGDDTYIFAGANSSRVIGGGGITSNVPAEFWAEWSKMYAGMPALKKGLIFSQPTVTKAQDEAKERSGDRTGYEPLDKDKPAPGIEPRKD